MERLERALRPFALLADAVLASNEDGRDDRVFYQARTEGLPVATVRYSDLRAAREALAPSPTPRDEPESESNE